MMSKISVYIIILGVLALLISYSNILFAGKLTSEQELRSAWVIEH